MGYITITNTGKTITVEFGDYAGAQILTGVVPLKKTYQKQNIEVSLTADDPSFININNYLEKTTFSVSYDGAPNTFKIDKVDETEPIDNEHLYHLIANLLA